MTDDRKLVPFDRRRRTPDPARVREFAQTARKLQREREESAAIVDKALRETPRSEWPRLVEEPSLRNSGALDRLSREVQRLLDRDPQEALAMSNLATAIAETLPPDAYPAVVLAQMKAQAWKDRGQALAYVARYDDALAAIDRAEAVLAPFGTLAHDRAVARFARAMTLREIDRLEESLALLTECRTVFLDHGDARLNLVCGIVEAMVLHRLGHFRESRDMSLALIPVAQAQNDRSAEACLHNNLGYTLLELSQFDEASAHLTTAHTLLVDLGRPVDAARTELARGRVLLRSGETSRAIAVLFDARAAFLCHGLVEEAGLCALDIVDGFLIRGALAEAETLARDVVSEFVQAGLNTRAITALGYLSHAIVERKASARAVDTVRQYLRALRKDPKLEFVVL